MSVVTAPSPAAPALAFAQSHSRAVGMHGGLMQKLEQYAPRIASLLKLGTYGNIAASGYTQITAAATGATLAPSMLVVAGILLLASGVIMIIYGNKEKQKERAAWLGESEAEAPPPMDPISRIFYEVSKIASPAKYPIESASGLGLLASVCMGITGAMTGNWYFVGIAVLATLATGVALFGHEGAKNKGNDTGLSFVQSQSISVGGITGMLKDNPVRVSSILLFAAGALSLLDGINRGDIFFKAAGVCALISNAIMGVFVRKNDYNVNADKQDAPQQPNARPTPRISHASATRIAPGLPHGAALA